MTSKRMAGIFIVGVAIGAAFRVSVIEIGMSDALYMWGGTLTVIGLLAVAIIWIIEG